jgi:hypothetical protein
MWDIFISHATEDKNTIARPLSNSLKKRGIKVWFDEFELKVGDSIIEKINEGLIESKNGLIILSPDFFSKNWTKRELNILTTRMIEKNIKLFPIWHNISIEQIKKVNPILSDIYGISTNKGIEFITNEILDKIQPLSSFDSSFSFHKELLDPEYDINERILRRYDSLIEMYNYFKEALKVEKAYINRSLLYTAVICCFDDIEKQKTNLKIVKEDRHRVASLTIKWLAKIRPIQLKDDITTNTTDLLLNEIFALIAGFGFLDINLNSIPEEIINSYKYSLRYNELNEKQLSRELYLLEKLYK